jgi:glutamine synthetase adenylyltransferase
LEAEPTNASYRQNLGKSLANLTQLLRQLRDSDGELQTLRQRQTLWKNDPIELQSAAEELALLINRTPQLVDELNVALGQCKAVGVDIDLLLRRPAFQSLPQNLRDRLK